MVRVVDLLLHPVGLLGGAFFEREPELGGDRLGAVEDSVVVVLERHLEVDEALGRLGVGHSVDLGRLLLPLGGRQAALHVGDRRLEPHELRDLVRPDALEGDGVLPDVGLADLLRGLLVLQPPCILDSVGL